MLFESMTKSTRFFDILSHMDGNEPVVQFFSDQELEFTHWLDEHPNGYVFNEGGFKVHDSGCPTLKGLNMTTRYGKACSTGRQHLEEWCRNEYGSESGSCAHCTGRHTVGELPLSGE